MAGLNTSGFYHDPPLWFGTSLTSVASVEPPDFERFDEAVVRKTLANGIEVKVTIEGMVGFDFSAWEPGRHAERELGAEGYFDERADVIMHRTQVMNAFLALLYANELTMGQFGHRRMVVTPELVIPMNLDNSDRGFANASLAHLASSRYPRTYQQNVPYIMDYRLTLRNRPVPVEVIEKTIDDLSDLMEKHQEDGILLADIFLRASKDHQDHNHNSALIRYWTVCEKLLNELWRSYQDENTERDGQQFISGRRKQILNDGRSFTASVIAEVLSLSSRLDFDLYQKLSRVRKARNDWMHALKSITAEDARTAGEAAEEMMRLVRGIEFRWDVPRSIHG